MWCNRWALPAPVTSDRPWVVGMHLPELDFGPLVSFGHLASSVGCICAPRGSAHTMRDGSLRRTLG